MKRALALVLLALGETVAGQSFGCGACIEDQIAATYDHAVVKRAEGRRHLVVFGQIKGAADTAAETAKIAAAAAGVGGIDRGTVRTSAALAAFSFALDPATQGADQAVAALQKRLRNERVKLVVLRVIGSDATASRN
jgi:hypothetical protein